MYNPHQMNTSSSNSPSLRSPHVGKPPAFPKSRTKDFITTCEKMEDGRTWIDTVQSNTEKNLGFNVRKIIRRISYGLNEDSEKKRSPHLVQYKDVDEAIKVANRNTASETVR